MYSLSQTHQRVDQLAADQRTAERPGSLDNLTSLFAYQDAQSSLAPSVIRNTMWGSAASWSNCLIAAVLAVTAAPCPSSRTLSNRVSGYC